MAKSKNEQSSCRDEVNALGASQLVNYSHYDPFDTEAPDDLTVYERISIATEGDIASFKKLGPFILVDYQETHLLQLYRVDVRDFNARHQATATALCTYHGHDAAMTAALVMGDTVLSADDAGYLHRWQIPDQDVAPRGCLRRRPQLPLVTKSDALFFQAHQHKVIAMDVTSAADAERQSFATAGWYGEIKFWHIGETVPYRTLNIEVPICDLRGTISEQLLVLTEPKDSFLLGVQVIQQGEVKSKQTFEYANDTFFFLTAEQVRLATGQRVVAFDSSGHLGLFDIGGASPTTRTVTPHLSGKKKAVYALSRDLFFCQLTPNGKGHELTVCREPAEPKVISSH